MTQKDIVDCFDSVKTTEIQKQKMLNTILASKKRAVLPVKRKTRFAFAPIAAAIAVLIISTTTVLAVTFNWHEALLSYFNPTPEQVETLDGAVAAPNVTLTHSGLTVSVIQTIADSFGVYVLYEVIAQDEAFVFPEEIYVSASLFRPSDFDDGVVSGSNLPVILENTGNRVMVLQHFFSTAPTTAERVELYISGLHSPTEEWDYDGRKVETLFQSSWRLIWDLDFIHTGITLLPNETVTVAGASSTITQIVLTPLSAVISFEGDWLRPPRPDPSFVSIRKHYGATITFGPTNENPIFLTATGEGSQLPPGMLPENTEGNFEQAFFYNFDTIIDVSDIESITIGDVTIPVG